MSIRGTVEIEGTISGKISSQESISGNVVSTGQVSGDLSTGAVFIKDYNKLENRPSIENIVLEGDKTFKQLGLDTLSVQEIEKILYLE